MAQHAAIVLSNASRIGIRDALKSLAPPPNDKGLETELYMAVAADLISPHLPQNAIDELTKVANGEQPAALIEGFPIGDGKQQQAEKISLALAGIARMSLNYTRADSATPHVSLDVAHLAQDAKATGALDTAIIQNPPVPRGHTVDSFYQSDPQGNKQLLAGVDMHAHFPVLLLSKHGNLSAFTRVLDKSGEVFIDTSLKQGSMLFIGAKAPHMRTVSIAKKNAAAERDVIAIQLAETPNKGFDKLLVDSAREEFLVPNVSAGMQL